MTYTQQIDWDAVFVDLSNHYREVEMRQLALPMVSFMPFLLFSWNYLKFVFSVIIDIILIIPLNLIIFLRNIFPGRWRYRVFSWPYIKYVALWFWRGEAPMAPIIVVRPLVRYFASLHVRNRMKQLKKHVFLDTNINESDRNRLMSSIDHYIAHWRGATVVGSLFSFGLPVISPVAELYRQTYSGSLPTWFIFVAFFIFSYALGIVLTAFLVKRGLMLGATGRSSYFPGSFIRSNGYATEMAILRRAKVNIRELPVDIFFVLLNLPLGFWFALKINELQRDFITRQMELFATSLTQQEAQIFLKAFEAESTQNMLFIQAIMVTIIIALCIFAWLRRRSLGRI